MKLQLHLIEDEDVVIRVVGVDGYKEFNIGKYKEIRKNINIELFNYPTKWDILTLNKVIKEIFKRSNVSMKNENLKRMYRKYKGDELQWI